MITTTLKAAIVASFALTSSLALANFSLAPEQSSVSFLSTKNVNATEIHRFEKFSGTIDEDGKLNLSIDLSSVNTNIPIRNERMKSMLFKVADFAEARFEGQLDESLLGLSAGESTIASVAGKLSISGTTKEMSFNIVVTGLQDGKLSASTIMPTVIDAAEFGLDGGIEALREVAKLNNISQTVPLSFYVVFEQD